jgi:hypothetical protein
VCEDSARSAEAIELFEEFGVPLKVRRDIVFLYAQARIPIVKSS